MLFIFKDIKSGIEKAKRLLLVFGIIKIKTRDLTGTERGVIALGGE